MISMYDKVEESFPNAANAIRKLTDTKLIVYHEHLTFKVSKHENKTYVSIRVYGVMLI